MTDQPNNRWADLRAWAWYDPNDRGGLESDHPRRRTNDLLAAFDELEAVARELFDIFIEGGYAEPGDAPLLDRVAAALRVPQEENDG